MKIKEHYDVPEKDLPAFLKELAGQDFTITSNAETHVYHIVAEAEYTEPEYNMRNIRLALNTVPDLTDEEKTSLEYAISCIKTLADMGVIK